MSTFLHRLVLSIVLGAVQTGTGKVDPARKFKCNTAAREPLFWNWFKLNKQHLKNKLGNSPLQWKFRSLFTIFVIDLIILVPSSPNTSQSQELILWHKLLFSKPYIFASQCFEVVDLKYFKPWILMDQIIEVWNIKGLLVFKDIGLRKFKFVAKIKFHCT